MSCVECSKWENKDWITKKYGEGNGICHYFNEIRFCDSKGCIAGNRFNARSDEDRLDTFMNLPIGTRIKVVSGVCEGNMYSISSKVMKSASGIDVYCYKSNDGTVGIVSVKELIDGIFFCVLDEDEGETTTLDDYVGGTIYLD